MAQEKLMKLINTPRHVTFPRNMHATSQQMTHKEARKWLAENSVTNEMSGMSDIVVRTVLSKKEKPLSEKKLVKNTYNDNQVISIGDNWLVVHIDESFNAENLYEYERRELKDMVSFELRVV